MSFLGSDVSPGSRPHPDWYRPIGVPFPWPQSLIRDWAWNVSHPNQRHAQCSSLGHGEEACTVDMEEEALDLYL